MKVIVRQTKFVSKEINMNAYRQLPISKGRQEGWPFRENGVKAQPFKRDSVVSKSDPCPQKETPEWSRSTHHHILDRSDSRSLFRLGRYSIHFKIHVAVNHCTHANTQLCPLISLIIYNKKL